MVWKMLKHKQLVEQVFSYTRDTIATFARESLMPDMVQMGNEITQGMLWPDSKLPDNLDNFADSGICGVDVGRGAQPMPRIMIHIERSGDYNATVWSFDNLNSRHVPFDVIGLSYYPCWHGEIVKLRGNLHDLVLRYQRSIILVGTAYNWTPGDFIGKKTEFSESPTEQADFMRAVDAAVRATPRKVGLRCFLVETCRRRCTARTRFL